jgi:membrane fusion protein (multidrug efflux system)
MTTDSGPATMSTNPEHEAVAPPGDAWKKRLRLGVILAVVLGIAAWGVGRYRFSRTHVTTDNAQVEGHVTVIAPKVQAFVDRVLVDDNQHVAAGDTLVVLDTRDLRMRLAEAEAELENARAAAGAGNLMGQATAQLHTSQAQASALQAAVVSAEAANAKAQADLARYRGLAAKAIIPAQQLDAAEAAARAAQADLEAAKRQAAAAESQVTGSTAGLRAARARLTAAETAVETANLELSYAMIVAPQAGTVARRNVDPGALVQVGQALMSIVPDQEVWITANLKETQLADVAVGDSADFTVDAYPGRRFRGHVESLSPATGATFALLPPDNATGNFTKVVQRVPVRIGVDSEPDSGRPLRPGMSVVVTIATD